MNRIEYQIIKDNYPKTFANYPAGIQEDIERIQNIVLCNGYHLSLKQADDLWERYARNISPHSDWTKLPESDDELAQILLEEI